QAEDGIRDFHVTGVQTCALPIYAHRVRERLHGALPDLLEVGLAGVDQARVDVEGNDALREPERVEAAIGFIELALDELVAARDRSEERRVGEMHRTRQTVGCVNR